MVIHLIGFLITYVAFLAMTEDDELTNWQHIKWMLFIFIAWHIMLGLLIGKTFQIVSKLEDRMDKHG